jgi:hypothetical protein
MTSNAGYRDVMAVRNSTQVQRMVTALRASKEHRISPQVLASVPATARFDRPNRLFTLWNVSRKEA